jgi:putative endonuclease
MTEDCEWFVYILQCVDGSLYCGIAKDPQLRFEVHVSGKGARYTRGRGPLKMLWLLSEPTTHGRALRVERYIKRLPKTRKLEICAGRLSESLVALLRG